MPEKDRYPGVIAYINYALVPQFTPRLGFSAFWTVDTSLETGDSEAMWSRPDVTSIIVGRGKYAPTSELTLISGEVKVRSGSDLKAVHQTLAQSRYSHCAYLFCELDIEGRDANLAKELALQCARLGLGFTTFSDSNDVSTYRTHTQALRKSPSIDDLDHYIETRLDEHLQDAIRQCLNPNWGFH